MVLRCADDGVVEVNEVLGGVALSLVVVLR